MLSRWSTSLCIFSWSTEKALLAIADHRRHRQILMELTLTGSANLALFLPEVAPGTQGPNVVAILVFQTEKSWPHRTVCQCHSVDTLRKDLLVTQL